MSGHGTSRWSSVLCVIAAGVAFGTALPGGTEPSPAIADDEPPAVAPKADRTPPVPNWVRPFLVGEMDPDRYDSLRAAFLRSAAPESALIAATIALSGAEELGLRAAAASSLCELHVLGVQLPFDVLPAIERLAEDRDPRVRRNLVGAMALVDTVTSRRLLLQWAIDEDEDVRAQARWALRARLGGIANLSLLLARRGKQLDEWLIQATVPIAGKRSDRFVTIDVAPRPASYQIELPAPDGIVPKVAWITAEVDPVPADAFPDLSKPPVPRYLVRLQSKGDPEGSGGGGSTAGWAYRANHGAHGTLAHSVLARELSGGRIRLWIRETPVSRIRELIQLARTRPPATKTPAATPKARK